MQPEAHEAFAAKYVLTPVRVWVWDDSKEKKSGWWSWTHADVTGTHTGLLDTPETAPPPSARLELRLYRKLQQPRLLLYLVDGVQHRLETVRQKSHYSALSHLLCVVLVSSFVRKPL